MITLAIDTSTSRGGVAVFGYGELLMDETFLAERSHSATLFAALERARALSNRITNVVVGLGPGSYAGVRIAIAAAIGMQLALGSKLVGIASVAALETEVDQYLAIGDARRDAFYYTRVREGVCSKGPLLLSEAELRQKLDRHPTLPVFATEPLAVFPTTQIALPSAAKLARLAAAGLGILQQDDLEPIYLREPYITPPRVRTL